MGKGKLDEVKGFSGKSEDWTWFKAKLLASAASKKNNLDEWMDVVDENINDPQKWTVLDSAQQKKEYISKDNDKKTFQLTGQETRHKEHNYYCQ